MAKSRHCPTTTQRVTDLEGQTESASSASTTAAATTATTTAATTTTTIFSSVFLNKRYLWPTPEQPTSQFLFCQKRC